ncbi:hypothetical protein MTO96_028333 [Rhipicephalus appendiculatus]
MSSDEEEIVPRRKRNVRVIVDEEEEQSSSSADSESEGGSGDEDDDDDEGSSGESGSSSEEADSAAEDEGGGESEWEEIPQELLMEGCQQQVAIAVAAVPTKKAVVAVAPRKAADAAGEASDSDLSDAQAERCAVCLNRFLGQEVGTPESCDHIFCLDCIQEWAKNMNTCPVDRSVFRLILVRKGDHVVHQISVPAPGEQEEQEQQEEEDLTYCEVCVPIEEWYCPDCAPDHAPLEDEPLPDDVMEEFRDMLASRFRPGQVGGLRRAIARTRASETVRTRIQRRRAAIEEVTTSSPEPCQRSLSSARRAPAKRSSAPTRRKTSSRKSSGRKTTKRKRRSTGHRRKRKTKTKGSSAKRRKTTTGSSRKSHRKGGKRKSSRRTTRRSRLSSRPLACPPIGSTYGPSFSLFGDRDELVSLDGSCDEDSGGRYNACPAQGYHGTPLPKSKKPSQDHHHHHSVGCVQLWPKFLLLQHAVTYWAASWRCSLCSIPRVASQVLLCNVMVLWTCVQCLRQHASALEVPPGSPAESPASPPPSSIGGHSTGSANQAPSRRASSGSGYTSSCVGASGDNGTTPSRHDDHAQREGCGSYHHLMVPSPPDAYTRKNGRDRTKNGPVEEDDDIDIYKPSVNGESPTRVSATVSIGRESMPRRVPAGVVDHDEEASSSENELVIDEQENAADVPEDEEVAGDHLKAAEESEEEGPILETDNVRSPSPENDEGTSQVSDEEGGLEIVENGNSSDGEQGEDESNGAKEGDDGEVRPLAEEEESSQTNPEEEETGSMPVEDTPASPTEEGSSIIQDAPSSPPC